MLPKTVEVLSNTEEIQAVKQEEEGYLELTFGQKLAVQ